MQKKKLGAVVLAAFASLTAGLAASADGPVAKFDAVAPVAYVGGSLDSSNPTSSTARFDIAGGKAIGATVSTRNEMVLATVASSNCSGDGCPKITPYFAPGLPVVSLHDSVAYLRIEVVKQVPYSAVTPAGLVSLTAEVASGKLSGPLAGHAAIGSGLSVQTAATITGKGEYACFAPLPGPLAPCIAGYGTFAPIFLDVFDTGTITGVIADASTSASWLIKGDIEVSAVLKIDLTGLYTGRSDAYQSGGAIYLKNATATPQ